MLLPLVPAGCREERPRLPREATPRPPPALNVQQVCKRSQGAPVRAGTWESTPGPLGGLSIGPAGSDARSPGRARGEAVLRPPAAPVPLPGRVPPSFGLFPATMS